MLSNVFAHASGQTKRICKSVLSHAKLNGQTNSQHRPSYSDLFCSISYIEAVSSVSFRAFLRECVLVITGIPRDSYENLFSTP